MTIQFAVTAGSPRMARATNIPQLTGSWWASWIQIVSYGTGNGVVFTLEGAVTRQFLRIEQEVTNELNLYTRNGIATPTQATNIWNDGRTDWNFLCIVPNTTTVEIYLMNQAATTLTHTSHSFVDGISTMTSMSYGDGINNFPTTSDGTCNYAGNSIGTAVLNEAQVYALSRSLKPKIWSDLNFWNHDLVAGGSVGTDFSGTGGNFTVTGTPTLVTSSPPVSFQQAQAA